MATRWSPRPLDAATAHCTSRFCCPRDAGGAPTKRAQLALVRASRLQFALLSTRSYLSSTCLQRQPRRVLTGVDSTDPLQSRTLTKAPANSPATATGALPPTRLARGLTAPDHQRYADKYSQLQAKVAQLEQAHRVPFPLS